MDADLMPSLPSVVADVELVAKYASDAVYQLEAPHGGILQDVDVEEKLEHYLRALFHKLLFHLEALGLAESRRSLLGQWALFEKAGIAEVKYAFEPGVAYSDVLIHLESYIDCLRAYTPTADKVANSRAELIAQLRKTALLVERRKGSASREKDVQSVMDDYLGVIYCSNYCRQFSLPGVVRNFKPDAGIISLQTVIEFKFADSEQELSTALGGLFEDSAGYRASLDWTHFVSVVYMTGAYGTEEDFRASFDRAGMIDWVPVLVTGKGARLKKSRGGADESTKA